ncbi:lanthionine synthetase C family protein [Pseudosporangium ferrugineum]|uniref:Lanthionine synthetase-like protein n=1 Tax=Pseudosporangium ferrugineum TaxID=439699 RepID=A0A2T0RBW0_9ACTN|nr:lanthionine synthetase C family protein [Pseudosporangium ferrugineum]PRY18629.1 lanthionine synthetase-like protein [Pseudosporangium ferrugineum]
MNPGQSLANGSAGIALFHLETGNYAAAIRALRDAVADGVSIADGASLFHGAPAIAFVLAATDHPQLATARAVTAEATATLARRRVEAAHRRIDRRAQPHYAEYDLIRGLTGLGVVLRRLGDHDLLRHVLDYFVRLTEPVHDLPGWWCHNSPHHAQPAPGGGHANFGMAHGITGPLALLSLALLDGTTVAGHTTAIERICRWLDTWQRHTHGITWWPQTLTRPELHASTPTQQGPLRPSWCYGTPGIVRAQQLAAHALGDRDRQHRSETAFTTCITDPTQTVQLIDRGLCHGTAGLLATARRITTDAHTPIPLPVVERLHQQFAASGNEPAGLLEGTTGSGLVDTATTSTVWDACLLLA